MKDPFAPLSSPAAGEQRVDMGNVHRASMPLPETFPAVGPAVTDANLDDLGVTYVAGSVRCTCPCGCQRATLLQRENMRVSRIARAVAPHARCTDCKAPGHFDQIDEAEEAALVAQSFAEAAHSKHERAIAAWTQRVPSKFRDAPGDDDPFLRDRVERFKQGVPSGFIVSGSYGSGKTWMSFGFLNLLVRQGLIHPSEILFGRENELLGVISMGTFAEQEEARRRLADPKHKIVYVDDVGQGNFRNARDAHSIWNHFADGVWSTDRVIVISTNYSLAPDAADASAQQPVSQFEQWVGGAAMDRLGSLTGYAAEVMGVGEEGNHRRRISRRVEEAWREQRDVTRATVDGTLL